MAYFAAGTSQTLFQGNLDFEKAAEGEDTTAFNIDCRDNLADESLRLDNPLDICDQNFDEGWIGIDGFQALGGDLNPWRGEAVITGEGDVQIGFHQRLPGGEDFRFSFVIDPNFRPQRCTTDANGETEAVDIDGDWIENWSGDVDDGILYYLTNGAFQFNPASTGVIWSLPQEWRSGGAFGRIGAEDLIMRPVYYATPSAYFGFAQDENTGPPVGTLFFSDQEEGADPTTGPHRSEVRRVEDISESINEELEEIMSPIRTQVHANEWRAPDGSAAGLDSWVELHYSYVRFDEGTTFEKGSEFSGEFQLMFDAQESQSRVAVSGRFTVNNLKRDRWVTDDVQGALLEENGTRLCTGLDAPEQVN